jgi:hypothetical protein
MRGLERYGLTLALAAGLATGGVAGLRTAAAAEGPKTVAMVATSSMKPAPARYETSSSWHAHRAPFFQRKWGLDIVGVRRVSSGSMLRFDYRVVDPTRASVLTDTKAKPYLIDETTHTALAVPAMENIGELRQVAPLQTNRTYFIIFGNPGGLVKRGGHVTLMMGNLRAEGMVVE